MKSFTAVVLFAFLLFVKNTSAQEVASEKYIKDKCTRSQDAVMNNTSSLEKTKWKTLVPSCIEDVKRQIGMEYNAAMKYLTLGAHFSRDVVNRPGFAKFFFESASEERQHAIKLIEYLSMRGELVTDVKKLIKFNPIDMPTIHPISLNGKEALEMALKAEVEVTESIVSLMKLCENDEKTQNNDYHIVDWLTAEYLDEQYKGQREIAGRLSTLLKMGRTNYDLGEFLFDKKLLSNEV